jgi:glutaredoxin
MKRALIGMCTLAVVSGAVVAAELYRWVDENGKVEYRDTPPPQSAKKVEQRRFGANLPPVKLYTHPGCGEPCVQAKKLLAGRKVPFQEIAVLEEEDLEELQKVTGASRVPVLMVGSDATHGFSASEYNVALDAAGFRPVGGKP